MYYSCNLGAVEFCAKLHLGCSSQFSLFNAANFFLFRVVIFYGKNNDKSVIFDYFLAEREINFILTVINEKSEGKSTVLEILSSVFCIKKICVLCFRSSYLYLFLAGNIIV